MLASVFSTRPIRLALFAGLAVCLAACASVGAAPPPAPSPVAAGVTPDDAPASPRDMANKDVDVILSSGAVRKPDFCNPPKADQFDWPPPEPTDSVRLDPRLFGLTPKANTSVGDVAEAVRRSFVKAGHVEIGFKSVGCDGFAMVSRIERIHSDGRPMEGRLRFLPPGTDEPWSLTGYIRQLLSAPEGKYRQIVMLGTDKSFTAFADAPTTAELMEMMDEASPVAASLLNDLQWTREHELVALIYEYERPAGNGAPVKVAPRGIGGTNHLVGAGFLRSGS